MATMRFGRNAWSERQSARLYLARQFPAAREAIDEGPRVPDDHAPVRLGDRFVRDGQEWEVSVIYASREGKTGYHTCPAATMDAKRAEFAKWLQRPSPPA